MKNSRMNISLEKTTVALGFLTWGFGMLLRTSFGYYVDVLSLSSAQVGVANAFTSALCCLSSIVAGKYVENKGGNFKVLAVAMFLCFVSEIILSLANSFTLVLLAKAIMGIGCGPLFSLIMSSVKLVSLKETYPKNVGFVSNGEAIISTIFGPLIIVTALNVLGFKKTNIILAEIALICAVCWILTNRNNKQQVVKQTEKGKSILLFKNKDYIKCIIGGSLTMIACWSIYMYVPNLLASGNLANNLEVGWIMTIMGFFMAMWMMLMPALYAFSKGNSSKNVVLISCVLSFISIVSIAFKPSNIIFVGLFILCGGFTSVSNLFFLAIVVNECVEKEKAPAALAYISAICELVGSSLGPMVIGFLADKTSLKTGLVCAAICVLISGLIAKSIKTQN